MQWAPAPRWSWGRGGCRAASERSAARLRVRRRTRGRPRAIDTPCRASSQRPPGAAQEPALGEQEGQYDDGGGQQRGEPAQDRPPRMSCAGNASAVTSPSRTWAPTARRGPRKKFQTQPSVQPITRCPGCRSTIVGQDAQHEAHQTGADAVPDVHVIPERVHERLAVRPKLERDDADDAPERGQRNC